MFHIRHVQADVLKTTSLRHRELTVSGAVTAPKMEQKPANPAIPHIVMNLIRKGIVLKKNGQVHAKHIPTEHVTHGTVFPATLRAVLGIQVEKPRIQQAIPVLTAIHFVHHYRR